MSNNGLSSNAQPATGDGAAGPRKRKIDRSEWPTLLARRQAGATQAQIAQDYGVSQGTVSQILKRARAEAEGQPVADLDGDSASEVEGSNGPGMPNQDPVSQTVGTPSATTDTAPTDTAPTAAAPSAAGPSAAGATHTGVTQAGTSSPSGQEGSAPGSAQVTPPANDATTPRRTLTTRSRSSAESQASGAASSAGVAEPARPAAAPAAGEDDAAPAQPVAPGGTAADEAGRRSGNALADRLREATERCAHLVDQKATSDTLSSAVHEVRRALAAIEIDAAKQNSPAAQRPRQAPPSRPSQSANAAAQQPPRAPEPFEPPRREPGVDSSKAAGRVKFFKPEKGFGFIIPDDGGDDIFVGKDTVQAAGIDRLSEGDRVRYTPGPGAKGLEAKTIERIG